ncbi:hypothetical protein CsSME_00002031 [Camellia sinensis var. sinensis]
MADAYWRYGESRQQANLPPLIGKRPRSDYDVFRAVIRVLAYFSVYFPRKNVDNANLASNIAHINFDGV